MNKLIVEIKSEIGKRNNNRLRKRGYIPAIIYNKYINLSIQFEEKYILPIINLYKKNDKINILINNEYVITKIKNIQYHPYKNKIIHIDFIKI